MSDPNHEHSEGNWDEFSNEPSWNEYQWRKYLHHAERETARFLSFYNKLQHQPNHLDQIATQMGWDADDISLIDELSSNELESAAGVDDFDSAPYTLHRHPVMVVTRALYRDLRQSWQRFIQHPQSQLSAQLCWNYANSLHQAEMNVLLAIQALDLGDFGLAICHLKHSLTALNQSMALLRQITHPDPQWIAAFRDELHIRLFDLREMWIGVMGDCRTECKRRPDEQQD